MAQSKSSKKLFNMAYGLGATVVILGALFKIQHWDYGSEILTIGMIVEAIVFAISAFEPVEQELDWTKVYPELGEAEILIVPASRRESPEGEVEPALLGLERTVSRN